MSIKLEISSIPNRYSYITKNPELHKAEAPTKYGATGYGDKGLARHNQLKTIFNHPNAIRELNDQEIAAKFLNDRDNLSGMNLFEEIASKKDLIDEKIEARKSFLKPEDVETDSILKKLNDDLTVINTVLANKKITAEVIGELVEHGVGTGYNPDFPQGSVNFGYSKGRPRNRAKDLPLHAGAPSSPNLNYPSLNPNFDNNEVAATSEQVIVGKAGDGGFGSDETSSFSEPIIDKIIDKYTPKS